MRAGRRPATIAVLLGCVVGLAACGGGAATTTVGATASPGYRAGLDLHVRRSAVRREGALRVEELHYTSVGGRRVAASLAVPAASPPLGCLIYQGDIGPAAESLADVRAGMATLRLATFSIEPRGGAGSAATAAAVRQPEGLRALLLDTVDDLRVGLDDLQRRPECHANVGVLGTALGGAIATLLAAQDRRVKAAVLTSVGATFKQLLLVRPQAAKELPGLPKYVPEAARDPAALADAVRILGPYDPARWIGAIAPRPVMLVNGRFDPLVTPGDALQLAAAAGSPRTVLYFSGGHDPFAGPSRSRVLEQTALFLIDRLNLPVPLSR
jgi:pimeloyl-ACP methyl ester carboxylesterase